jgi:WD40 repeat protein
VSSRRLTDGGFSPDGRLLAVTAQDGTIRFVHLRTDHVEQLAYRTHGGAAVAFSPDGHLLALQDRTQAHFLDVTTRRAARPPMTTVWQGSDITWSPNSHYIAVTENLPDGQGAVAAVYDMRLHEEARVWGAPASSAVAWSPDGRAVAIVGEAGSGLELRRASDGGRIRGGWRDHAHTSSLAFNPDGSLLASGGDDGTVVLRDVATGARYGPPLVASSNKPVFVTFDPTGRLVVASSDGGLWRWDVTLHALLDRACAIAGRNLTRAEWDELQTGQPYIRACA